jgi:hypothetical protein
MTSRSSWSYVILPKGVPGLVFKFSYYIPAATASLADAAASVRTVLGSAAAVMLLEGVFGTSRKVLNDLSDFREDLQRGDRWTPVVTETNRRFIIVLVVLKLGGGAALALVWQPVLALLGLALIVCQAMYDRLRSLSATIAVAALVTSYLVRAMAVPALTGTWKLSNPLLVAIAGTILIAAARTIEWRKAETRYLAARQLPQKVDSAAFTSWWYSAAYHSFVYGLAVLLVFACVLSYDGGRPDRTGLLVVLSTSGVCLTTRPWGHRWGWLPFAAVWVTYLALVVWVMRATAVSGAAFLLSAAIAILSVLKFYSATNTRYFQAI